MEVSLELWYICFMKNERKNEGIDIMEPKQIVKKALEDYQRLTGLRSYIVYDNIEVQSASEKNYFCKCLKISTKALKMCEECSKETYSNARQINKECVYSCHAGLIKWAVPVNEGDFHCVIVSEGILAQKQVEEAEKWAKYLADEYDLNEQMLLRNFKIIQTMDEGQMNASIELLKNLLAYQFAIHREESVTAA